MTRGPVIAIDGPAGSGKSTLARGLSERLGLPYVNTGAMYRALTREALLSAVDVGDGGSLARLARGLEFAIGGERPGTLLVHGAEPGSELSSEEVESSVSRASAHPEVRAVMCELQRDLGRDGAVMEGRDIGSVVFPDAEVKIFLTASLAVRASRRVRERGGGGQVPKELAARDMKDATINPFVPSEDAAGIDTTAKGIREVLDEALAIVREKLEGRT